MKNPPTPDPKPGKSRQPPDHNPKDDPLPIDPPEQGKLEPMDDAFLHGDRKEKKMFQNPERQSVNEIINMWCLRI